MAKQTRTESDSLGKVEVPNDAYFGAFTVRAHQNFQISGLTAHEEFRTALGLVKLAAAKTNTSLGLILKKHSKALFQACEEFSAGDFDYDFPLDVFQAGAGTSYNMNANEIIANRANEILKAPKGSYKFIHPNDHVNMAQSTNDVIPTTSRLAALLVLPGLLSALEAVEKQLAKIAKAHKNTLKVGRTHTQDAVPITLGQEFDSYKEALQKSRQFIKAQAEDLKILGIGGTAVGTGINTAPKYKGAMVKNLSSLTKIRFKSGKNLTEMANNMNSFMNFSAALRSLATNLLNISGDLKLMNMGPKAGLSEITLPEAQAGSSIMPGKVNPSILECLDMIAIAVLGNDQTIQIAAQKSQFELNVFCPLIIDKLLSSMETLTNGLLMLDQRALQGLQVNTDRITELYDNSLVTATALAPYIGYQATAEIVKKALKNNSTIKEEAQKSKLLTEKQLKEILSVARTTKPCLK